MSEDANIADAEALILRARGNDEVQMIVAIVSLGMCRALAQRAISPSYACARFFGPALLGRLERLGVEPRLRDAVHLATELEDVFDIVPSAFDDSLQEIERNLLAAIETLATEPREGGRWLVPPDI